MNDVVRRENGIDLFLVIMKTNRLSFATSLSAYVHIFIRLSDILRKNAVIKFKSCNNNNSSNNNDKLYLPITYW